ncbi:MAG: transcriptional regulator BetI [Rhodobacteraceae bacterium]|nr:transcriptional regulator BetI [Paracoccaceae bacterium]
MPKTGMEPIRRKALIGATIAEIGALGSLDVTMGKIAKRAGVSSALAHHYFGGKDDLLLAAMRHLLMQLGLSVAAELKQAHSPEQRLAAIINASFADSQFSKATVSAWLSFYVQAQSSVRAARLLRVYTKRLHSNLVYDLKKLTGPGRADETAKAVGAMIDGFYIRHALQGHALQRDEMIGIINRYWRLSIVA